MLARANGAGVTAGLVALVLWPFYRAYPEAVLWPFAAAALVAGIAGAAILLLTGADLLFHRPRGRRIRPVRVFDVVIGFALVAFCLLALGDAAGQLPMIVR